MAAEIRRNDAFKLPASSLEEIFKIIQGYANLGRPASLGDLSKQTGMHTTVVSRNVGFLLSIGVLEGGMNKAATSQGVALGRALMHDVEEEVQRILHELVTDNEFLKNILAAVRIRKGMDFSALRSHIAYSAGQSKTGTTSTGTGAVVDLLKRSGDLEESDGKLVVASSQPSQAGVDMTVDGHSVELKQGAGKSSARWIFPSVPPSSPFKVAIEVQVVCSPDDLEGLGVKLRKVVDDFSKSDVKSESEER